MDIRPSARRDVLLTTITAVLVASFFALCYWQVTRALSGNTLSWAYVFEWPLFAGYVLYMWWRLSHERAPRPITDSGPAPDPGAAALSGDGKRAAATKATDEQDEED